MLALRWPSVSCPSQFGNTDTEAYAQPAHVSTGLKWRRHAEIKVLSPMPGKHKPTQSAHCVGGKACPPFPLNVRQTQAHSLARAGARQLSVSISLMGLPPWNRTRTPGRVSARSALPITQARAETTLSPLDHSPCLLPSQLRNEQAYGLASAGARPPSASKLPAFLRRGDSTRAPALTRAGDLCAAAPHAWPRSPK